MHVPCCLTTHLGREGLTFCSLHNLQSRLSCPLQTAQKWKFSASVGISLRQICGTNATYLDYEYHVSAGSRLIQSVMDNLTCEWQDMLLQYYLEAAEHGNIWPTPRVSRVAEANVSAYGTFYIWSFAELHE